MSVLPLSLFLRVEGGASSVGFLGRGSLPKREDQREGHSLVRVLGRSSKNQVLRGIAISPPRESAQLHEVV